jgi:AraC-like DNA-binding protein
VKYFEMKPGEAAQGFLHCLWNLETDDQAVQRVVPDGRPELIVNLGAPFEAFHNAGWRLQPRCFLAGQLTRPLRIRPSGPARILAARFLPQGAARVFDIAMEEITDDFLPADFACDSLESLEAELAARVRPGDPVVDEAVRRMSHCPKVPVDLGISPRHLERRFKRSVGLTPKLFCRIQRFQRVFREIERGGNWVEAALACGYYDQAHLIRDMRAFSGEAPSVLLNGNELARHFLSHFSKTREPGRK